MMRYSLLFFVGAFAALHLSAQPAPEPSAPAEDVEATEDTETKEPAEETEEPEQYRILFSVFVWPQQGILMSDSKLSGIPKVFYESPTGVQPLDLAFNASTELKAYQGPSPLVFFDLEEVIEEPPADAPPGTKPQKVIRRNARMTTEIPKKTDRVKIIVFPGKYKDDGTIRTAAISLESEQLQPDTVRLYNGSSQQLALQFETRTNPIIKMEPNAHMEFDTDEFSSATHARIFVYGEYDEKPRLFLTSKLYFTPGESNLLLLYPKSSRRFEVLNLGSIKEVDTQTLLPSPEEGSETEDTPQTTG